MVGWYHQLSGHESEHTVGDGDGQRSLACCSLWGCKESDMTERLNNSNNLFRFRDNKEKKCKAMVTCYSRLGSYITTPIFHLHLANGSPKAHPPHSLQMLLLLWGHDPEKSVLPLSSLQ